MYPMIIPTRSRYLFLARYTFIIVGTVLAHSSQAQRVHLPPDFYLRLLHHELDEIHIAPRTPNGALTSCASRKGLPSVQDLGEAIISDSTPFPESEIHAAVNPADSSNIVVSAMRLV